MKNERTEVARLNPLVGRDTADTIENLTTCLQTMGGTYSEKHKDESIGFFCSVVAAALAFEAFEIKSQRIAANTDDPSRTMISA